MRVGTVVINYSNYGRFIKWAVFKYFLLGIFNAFVLCTFSEIIKIRYYYYTQVHAGCDKYVQCMCTSPVSSFILFTADKLTCLYIWMVIRRCNVRRL
jgi:hypothetical protein